MEKNLELTIRMDNDHVEIDIYGILSSIRTSATKSTAGSRSGQTSWLARTNRKAPTIPGAFFHHFIDNQDVMWYNININ